MISIPNLIRVYRKRQTIKSYLARIGPLLAKRYGKSALYTPKQVEDTARTAGLPTDELCYALSIYCAQDAFDLYHEDLGEDCNYWQMRAEVAEHHFHGNVTFTPRTYPRWPLPVRTQARIIPADMITVAGTQATIIEGRQSDLRHHPCSSYFHSGRKTRRLSSRM